MADNSDSAFPSLAKSWRDSRDDSMVHETVGGMSLRDYFAAKALQGLTSVQRPDGTWAYGDAVGVAYEAYAIADAMLSVRAK